MKPLALILGLMAPLVVNAGVIATGTAPTGVQIELSDVVGYCPVGVGMHAYGIFNDRGGLVGAGCWERDGQRVLLHPYGSRATIVAPRSMFRGLK